MSSVGCVLSISADERKDTWLISNAICPCTVVSTTLVLNTPVWIAHNGEKEIKYECIT